VIKDGDKIYINSLGEEARVSATQTLGAATSKKINVNSATSSELDTLPGVGTVIATKIISLRPYKDVAELLSKKAVGNATYNKIKDLVSVQ
jgi:competence protein ComEA